MRIREPAAAGQSGGWGRGAARLAWRIAIVVRCRGRSAKLETSDPALRQFATGFIDDPDLMPRQCASARRNRQRISVRLPCRHSPGLAGKQIALDHIDARSAPQRRKRKSDRGFRQAVYRRDGLTAQPAGLETGGERVRRGRTDRLRAVERQPPA